MVWIGIISCFKHSLASWDSKQDASLDSHLWHVVRICRIMCSVSPYTDGLGGVRRFRRVNIFFLCSSVVYCVGFGVMVCFTGLKDVTSDLILCVCDEEPYNKV